VTVNKQRIGNPDYAVDDASLYVQKLYVSQNLIKSFSGGNLSVDREQIVEITDCKITVINEPMKTVKDAIAGAPSVALILHCLFYVASCSLGGQGCMSFWSSLYLVWVRFLAINSFRPDCSSVSSASKTSSLITRPRPAISRAHAHLTAVFHPTPRKIRVVNKLSSLNLLIIWSDASVHLALQIIAQFPFTRGRRMIRFRAIKTFVQHRFCLSSSNPPP